MTFLRKLKEFNYINQFINLDIIKSKLVANGNKSLLELIFILSVKLFRSALYIFFKIPRADVLFIFSTKNQKDALINVSNELSKSMDVANVSLSVGVKAPYRFPVFYSYLFAVLFLPVVVFEYLFILKSDEKTRLRNGFEDYVLSFGNLFFYYFYLKLARPKAIVLSNDHNSNIRVLLYVAKKINIKSIYIQHASVSQFFPPLEQFDLALLDGQYAKDTYSTIGPLSKELYLVGINKLDLSKRNIIDKGSEIFSTGTPCLGIALNPLYSEDKLLKLILILKKQNVNIVIRIHPSQSSTASEIFNNFKEFRFRLSDPSLESSADFITSVDCVIAGNSGILLETAVLNKISIYYDLDSIPYDYYGFISSGISIEMNVEQDNIVTLISEYKAKKSMNVKYYDYSFGSCLYGYSSSYCSNKILYFTNNTSK